MIGVIEMHPSCRVGDVQLERVYGCSGQDIGRLLHDFRLIVEWIAYLCLRICAQHSMEEMNVEADVEDDYSWN